MKQNIITAKIFYSLFTMLFLSSCVLSQNPSDMDAYIITYTNTHGDSPAQMAVVGGAALKNKHLPDLECQNYQFDGWYYNEEKITIGYKINSNLELTTRWTLPSSLNMISITDSTNNGYKLSPYKINAYETTYNLWYQVRCWAEKHGYIFEKTGREGYKAIYEEPDFEKFLPVTSVGYKDIIVWCNALSEKENIQPYYYQDSTLKTPIKNAKDITSFFCDSASEGYRLPTESEWKYAAYGAYRTEDDKKYKFSGSNNLEEVAVVFTYSGPKSVGTKKSNGIECYDMTGNIAEMCLTNGNVTVWGGHCTNDKEIFLELPGRELSNIIDAYPYLIGFRIAQSIISP